MVTLKSWKFGILGNSGKGYPRSGKLYIFLSYAYYCAHDACKMLYACMKHKIIKSSILLILIHLFGQGKVGDFFNSQPMKISKSFL